jgi:hypothetical protein
VARACSICGHSRVTEIDAALLNSVAYRNVAKQFGASESSVYRHSKEHLPVVSRYATSERSARDVTVESGSATSHLDHPSAIAAKSRMKRADLVALAVLVEKRTSEILQAAVAAGRHETALKAIRESRGNIELISKLEGLFKEGGDDGWNVLDLCKLSAGDLGLLLRASLGELSVRDQQTLLLQVSELAEFAPDYLADCR